VTSALQIDQQAPEVLVDTVAFQLLPSADDDSTQIFPSTGTQAVMISLADIPGTVLKTDVYEEVNGRLIFRASTDATACGCEVDGSAVTRSLWSFRTNFTL